MVLEALTLLSCRRRGPLADHMYLVGPASDSCCDLNNFMCGGAAQLSIRCFLVGWHASGCCEPFSHLGQSAPAPGDPKFNDYAAEAPSSDPATQQQPNESTLIVAPPGVVKTTVLHEPSF